MIKRTPKNKASPEDKSSPTPIDIHVGGRIKLRRTFLKISQGELGEMLGVTFQQVQKYERGANRVSASRLFHLGELLDVPVTFFFEGLEASKFKAAPGKSKVKKEDFSWLEVDQGDLMTRKETQELVRTYYQVKNRSVRKNYVTVLKALVAAQPK